MFIKIIEVWDLRTLLLLMWRCLENKDEGSKLIPLALLLVCLRRDIFPIVVSLGQELGII